MIQRRNEYQARKARLLRRMPDQPMREVNTPTEAAVVEMMSSSRLPTRIMSACVQTSNQMSRQAIRPARQ